MKGRELIDSKVGDTLQDRGFLSTSLADDFNFGGDVELILDVPAGVKAAYIANVTTHEGGKEEEELVLGPGLGIEVVSVEDGGDRPTVRGRIVPRKA